MILTSFKYSTPSWTLDQLILANANLIVGKNSSGKSKALQALSGLTSLISQRKSIEEAIDFSSEILLTDVDNDKIYFSLSVAHNRIIKETLILNGETIIHRDEQNAQIKGETVNPPENMLLMHVRRDVRKYPVIEKIIKWSEESVIRSFINRERPNHKELYELFSKFTPEMKIHLTKMANEVGFPITRIDTFDKYYELSKTSSAPTADLYKVPLILLKEKNVEFPLSLDNLSSGMYRTILLLILIEQLINLNHPALLAIDDLGEGLDYSRATKVGKLLFDVCEKHDIQLIATSNEEFMMNIVDISEWNILVREGETVRSITATVCPDEFEEFKFLGLSNFDFFTSDFLNRISSKLFEQKQ